MTEQGASAILAITLMMTLIPSLITLALAGAIWRFRLDDARMDGIRQDLETRRHKGNAAAMDADAFPAGSVPC